MLFICGDVVSLRFRVEVFSCLRVWFFRVIVYIFFKVDVEVGLEMYTEIWNYFSIFRLLLIT